MLSTFLSRGSLIQKKKEEKETGEKKGKDQKQQKLSSTIPTFLGQDMRTPKSFLIWGLDLPSHPSYQELQLGKNFKL